jgi:hypothetical protein
VFAEFTELDSDERIGKAAAALEIQPKFFPDCPICGTPATHRKHIPPESLPGRR